MTSNENDEILSTGSNISDSALDENDARRVIRAKRNKRRRQNQRERRRKVKEENVKLKKKSKDWKEKSKRMKKHGGSGLSKDKPIEIINIEIVGQKDNVMWRINENAGLNVHTEEKGNNLGKMKG